MCRPAEDFKAAVEGGQFEHFETDMLSRRQFFEQNQPGSLASLGIGEGMLKGKVLQAAFSMAPSILRAVW